MKQEDAQAVAKYIAQALGKTGINIKLCISDWNTIRTESARLILTILSGQLSVIIRNHPPKRKAT